MTQVLSKIILTCLLAVIIIKPNCFHHKHKATTILMRHKIYGLIFGASKVTTNFLHYLKKKKSIRSAHALDHLDHGGFSATRDLSRPPGAPHHVVLRSATAQNVHWLLLCLTVCRSGISAGMTPAETKVCANVT